MKTRLFLVFLCLFARQNAYSESLCSSLYKRIRKPKTEEEKSLLAKDKKAMGIYKYLYKLSYGDVINGAIPVVENPYNFLEPSPTFREQIQDYLALFSHFVPKSKKKIFSDAVLKKAESGKLDNFKTAVENILSPLALRPLFQAYPRYFTRVALGKSHDFDLDAGVRRRILQRLGPDALTREKFPVTNIEKGTAFKTFWAAVMGAPVGYAILKIVDYKKTSSEEALVIEKKNQLITLLFYDFRYEDLLQAFLSKHKRSDGSFEIKSLNYEDLKKIYDRFLELSDFDKWVQKVPKIEEVDLLRSFEKPLFKKYSQSYLSDDQKIEFVALEFNLSFAVSLLHSKKESEWFEYFRELSKVEMERAELLEKSIGPNLPRQVESIKEKLLTNTPLIESEKEAFLQLPSDLQEKWLELNARKINVVSEHFLGKTGIEKRGDPESEAPGLYQWNLRESESSIIHFLGDSFLTGDSLEIFSKSNERGAVDAQANLQRYLQHLNQWLRQNADIERELITRKHDEETSELMRSYWRDEIKTKLLKEIRQQ
jgi:hypothetical protein